MVLKNKKFILGSLAVLAAVSPVVMTVSCGSDKCDESSKTHTKTIIISKPSDPTSMQIIKKITTNEGKTLINPDNLPEDGYKIDGLNGLKFSKAYLTELIKSFEYVNNIRNFKDGIDFDSADNNFIIGNAGEIQRNLSSTIRLKSTNKLNRFTKKGYNSVKEAINYWLYKRYDFVNIDLSKLKCYQQLAEDQIASIGDPGSLKDKITFDGDMGQITKAHGLLLLSHLKKKMKNLVDLKDWTDKKTGIFKEGVITTIFDGKNSDTAQSISLKYDAGNVTIKIHLPSDAEGTDTALTKPKNLEKFDSLDWNSIITKWIKSSINKEDKKTIIKYINNLTFTINVS